MVPWMLCFSILLIFFLGRMYPFKRTCDGLIRKGATTEREDRALDLVGEWICIYTDEGIHPSPNGPINIKFLLLESRNGMARFCIQTEEGFHIKEGDDVFVDIRGTNESVDVWIGYGDLLKAVPLMG